MSQKTNYIPGQLQPSLDQSNVNHKKTDSLDFYISHGIPSEDITHEKIGQNILVFSSRSKPPVEDDSLDTSIRYLKFKRFNP